MVILDALAAVYAIRLAAWAAEVGQRTGYRGSWALGVHGSQLRGVTSLESSRSSGFQSDGQPFDAADYREVTTATHLELLERPQAVAGRLVGRLIRALGTEPVFAQALSAPERKDEP